MTSPATIAAGLTEAQLLADIETLLRSARDIGEWGDEHDQILARWRGARGEAGMEPWSWWWKLPEDESYRTDEPTREAVLVAARHEEPGAPAIELIEARTWADDIDVDDISWFADTRNHEIYEVPA